MRIVISTVGVLLLVLLSGCVLEPGQSLTAPADPNGQPVVRNQTTPDDDLTEVNVSDPDQEENENTTPKEKASEVEELLGKADARVSGLSYKYEGPETENAVYQFFAAGDKVRYVLPESQQNFDDDPEAYNAVYLDLSELTAEAWCDHRTCNVKGKKGNLSFEEAHILTPLEWLDRIGAAEKLGEEQMERRTVWRLNTTGFKVWVEEYYGVPYRVQSNGTDYKFSQFTFNGVTEEDVTAPAQP